MNSRIQNIDVLKGIGIIFVIMGHIDVSPIGYAFPAYLYTFHMPLFFWITGYLTYSSKKRAFISYVLNKMKTILLPYLVLFCLSLFYGHIILRYVFNEFIIPFDFSDTLRAFVYSSEWLNSIPTFNFALWYLPLLFIALIIYYFILKIKDIRIFIIITILLGIITIPFQAKFPGRPILHINVLPAALTFMCLGHIFKHFENRIKIHNIILIPIFAFTIWYAYYYRGNIAAVPNYLFFGSAVLSIYMYYQISQDFAGSKALAFLGRASLIIFGVHILVNNTYRFTPIKEYFIHWNGLVMYLINLVYVILISAGIYYVFEIIKRVKNHRNSAGT